MSVSFYGQKGDFGWGFTMAPFMVWATYEYHYKGLKWLISSEDDSF